MSRVIFSDTFALVRVTRYRLAPAGFSPVGKCRLSKVALYCEALPRTAMRCARMEPGSLTTEQCVDQPLQNGGSRLTGACRHGPLEGRQR